MLCPLADRAGIDNNFISIFPGLSRPVSAGPVIPFNPLRITFISLTPERFNIVGLHSSKSLPARLNALAFGGTAKCFNKVSFHK